jgi:hypothetical protein
MRIYTVGAVHAGDEAFLDYGLIVDEADSLAHYPRYCGAPGCRGTMVATVPAVEGALEGRRGRGGLGARTARPVEPSPQNSQ